MKFKIISLLAIVFLCGCKSKIESTKIGEMEWVEVAKGNLYGSGAEGIEAQNLVIENQSDWKALMNRTDSVNKVSDSFKETAIDFSEFTVIAVFDAVRESGGYSLELSVDSNSRNWVIHVNLHRPQGNATSVMTQPFHIIKITKSELPITFQ